MNSTTHTLQGEMEIHVDTMIMHTGSAINYVTNSNNRPHLGNTTYMFMCMYTYMYDHLNM